jgi:hypothetical protein
MKRGPKQESAPENSGLAEKREELESLKKHLSRMERILSKLRVEIGTLTKLYTEILDPRIRELDNLNRDLSDACEVRKRKLSAEEGSHESLFAHDGDKENRDIPRQKHGNEPGSRSSGSFKDLYRKVAKAIHPDLSTNEEERKWRQKLMAEANNAYAKKDGELLRTILRQWETAPRPCAEEDTAAEISLLQQKITWVKEKIRIVEDEVNKLKRTDLYSLLIKVEEAQYEGIDLLAEMAKKIDSDIEKARGRMRGNVVAESGSSCPEHDNLQRGRSINFPSNRPVGALFLREAGSESFLDWQSLGEAHGKVFIPTGKVLRLDVGNRSRDTSDCLTMLGSDDLQALFLYDSCDAELSCLRRLTGLRVLYLSGKEITDAGLENLFGLKSLRRLYIYNTSVSANGVENLRVLNELRYITFCGSGITENALLKIKESLPGCHIIILNDRKGIK